MENNFNLSEALREELRNAKNEEQVAEIIKASGQEVAPEIINRITKEIKHSNTDTELSVDELEAVSGGYDRDWLKDGCAATVEVGSWCGSNDACAIFSVIYYRGGPVDNCPECNGVLLDVDSSKSYTLYECQTCKKVFVHGSKGYHVVN